jgi:hypothetical protein
MRLSFEKIKEISEWLDTNQEIKFYQFLNSFDGENVYQKFKNILIKWEYHVNDFLTFTIDGSQIKIPMYYILQELTDDIEAPKVFVNNTFSFELQVPKTFQMTVDHIPIYDLITSISIEDVHLDFKNLDRENKQAIIDKLPANLFSKILEGLINDSSKIFKLNNESLSKFKINFYTNDPMLFLKNLFSNYSKEYFQDIIFYLSKRMSCDAILYSDIKDIDFYVKKYNEETEQQKNTMPSLDF